LLTLAGGGRSLLASVIKAILAFALSFNGAKLSQLSRLTALVVALEEAIPLCVAACLFRSHAVVNWLGGSQARHESAWKKHDIGGILRL
jgi:hypothetical protein